MRKFAMQRVRIDHDFPTAPVLETPRLVLRPFTHADAEAVFAYASDPELARFTRWSAVGHTTIDDTRAFLRSTIDAYRAGQAAPWAVIEKASGALIGTCGFVQWREQHRWAELAYALARPYWGRGYSTEAADEALRHAFVERDLMRVQAICYGDHHASCRVLTKLGMTLEGVLRQCVQVHGIYHDLKVFAMLHHEWDELHLLAPLALSQEHRMHQHIVAS
jgi:[ribosomal protein S5]-alanine N-acetyltransferase